MRCGLFAAVVAERGATVNFVYGRHAEPFEVSAYFGGVTGIGELIGPAEAIPSGVGCGET